MNRRATARAATFDFGLAMKTLLAALVLAAALLLVAQSASAQPNVVAEARAAGAVGEQADGYLGFPSNNGVSADLRARVDQINIQRRALYTRRAQERGVSANEMAAAVACEVFENRIAVGERYRGEDGQWRRHSAAGDIVKPSFCP
ncbi:YdbL family protein [Terricaulis sp.]|uniref:YdbL family protein n=1 Tax=Terricaulis sp. TaxID=2768686 RepID=UPI003783C410